jgi:hypothetical protein
METLYRIDNWQQEFANFIAWTRESRIKLDWVNWSCAKWAASHVYNITGYNAYAEFEDSYRSPSSAFAAIGRAGYKSLEDVLIKKFPPIELSFCRRGDLVWMAEEAIEGVDFMGAIGIAEPPLVWCLLPHGLGTALFSDAIRAYRIGF